MITTLLTGWNFMRLLRLALGITISFQAIQTHDLFIGLISGFLLFQVLTNAGCCGAGRCEVPVLKKRKTTIEDIEFEEIK